MATLYVMTESTRATESSTQPSYPSDVSDAEWEFLLPYLTLMTTDAPQRQHDLRAVFNAIRYLVRTGVQWRYLPNDFPPWNAVYQQARRWLAAGVYEQIAHDLRILERVLKDRFEQPTAAVLDGRTLRSSRESGSRAGYDGHKRKNGSKVHIAVDTLGNLLDVVISKGSEQERAQVGELTEHLKGLTDGEVEIAFVDQGYTGPKAAEAAKANGVRLEVVKHTQAKKGFVLLPRRWVVERTFGWLTRHRRLVRDYERLAKVLAGYHWIAFISILLDRIQLVASS